MNSNSNSNSNNNSSNTHRSGDERETFNGLYIPCDPDKDVYPIPLKKGEDYYCRREIKDILQCEELSPEYPQKDCTLFLRSDGVEKCLPDNQRASKILWKKKNPVKGDAILVSEYVDYSDKMLGKHIYIDIGTELYENLIKGGMLWPFIGFTFEDLPPFYDHEAWPIDPTKPPKALMNQLVQKWKLPPIQYKDEEKTPQGPFTAKVLINGLDRILGEDYKGVIAFSSTSDIIYTKKDNARHAAALVAIRELITANERMHKRNNDRPDNKGKSNEPAEIDIFGDGGLIKNITTHGLDAIPSGSKVTFRYRAFFPYSEDPMKAFFVVNETEVVLDSEEGESSSNQAPRTIESLISNYSTEDSNGKKAKVIYDEHTLMPCIKLIIKTMKREERCLVTCQPSYVFGSDGYSSEEFSVPGNTVIRYEIGILRVVPPQIKEHAKEIVQVEKDAEKTLTEVKKYKEDGKIFFQEKKYPKAKSAYKNGLQLLEKKQDIWEEASDEQLEEADELKIALNSNLALVFLEQENPNEAMKHCDKVLDLAPNHLKALYSKGKSYNLLREGEQALSWINRAIEIDPKQATDRAVKRELEKAQQIIREDNRRASNIFTKMFKEPIVTEEKVVEKKNDWGDEWDEVDTIEGLSGDEFDVDQLNQLVINKSDEEE